MCGCEDAYEWALHVRACVFTADRHTRCMGVERGGVERVCVGPLHLSCLGVLLLRAAVLLRMQGFDCTGLSGVERAFRV